MELILFYLFAGIAIVSALLVVSLKDTARALFLFFIVLFSIAGMYIFALADFVAITQIMVYVGGVLVLMIFAFMLSNKELLTDIKSLTSKFISVPNIQAILLVIGFLAVLLYGIYDLHGTTPAWIEGNIANGAIIQPTDNNIEQLGLQFMTRYILPFEVISIFLMVTLIGAAHMSRKEKEA